jgi:methyl-accepting chemotaxis protein
MDIIKSKIEEIGNVVSAMSETARDVNRHSHTRKKIASDSLVLLRAVIGANGLLLEKYDRIYVNFQDLQETIVINAATLVDNVEFFSHTIGNIDNIKNTLTDLEGEIDKLTIIVDDIRGDTDEIFTLALNASIVSSKYSHTSGVFDILANKLNEMSNFINQNLENIVHVVKPITEGIVRLIANNSLVMEDAEGGYNSFMGFNDILEKQKDSVEELMARTAESGNRIQGQRDMLEDLKQKINQMDQDADGAITGSGNVAKTGESLGMMAAEARRLHDGGLPFRDKVSEIAAQAAMAWQTARNVNEKSRSQLEFSQSSVVFCDQLVLESTELERPPRCLISMQPRATIWPGFSPGTWKS